MSEMVSGAASQIFQQIVENQGLKQQPSPAGKSFEQYMQQDKTLQTQNAEPATNDVNPAEKIEKTVPVGTDLDGKLRKLETDLAQKYTKVDPSQDAVKKQLEQMELTITTTRTKLFEDMNKNFGNTSKVTSDIPGKLTQVEGEYKQLEEIMKSGKNLSQGELLALQARLYQVSQHIEVMSKVVDQMAGGIKTVLNTNI